MGQTQRNNDLQQWAVLCGHQVTDGGGLHQRGGQSRVGSRQIPACFRGQAPRLTDGLDTGFARLVAGMTQILGVSEQKDGAATHQLGRNREQKSTGALP